MSNIKAGIDLFAGIEDIFRVENVFSYFEELKHLLGVHEVEERCTDDAVVVFAADVAFKLHRCFIKRISHFFY